MKAVKLIGQFGVIMFFTLLGEILSSLIPLPIPAGIYGIVLLFACLMTGAVKADSIREISGFLTANMPFLFIPAVVGLMDAFDVLLPVLVPVAVILVVSTFAVMAASGLAAQRAMRRGGKEKDHA